MMNHQKGACSKKSPDEQESSPSRFLTHSTKFDSQRDYSRGNVNRVPCGLINQGMTCYLNVVLQTLFMTKKYRNAIRSLGKGDTGAYSEENFSKTLDDFFQKLDEKDDEKPVHTIEVTKALNITNVYEQQDAAEYLQMILHKTPEPSKVFRGIVETITKCMSCEKKTKAETEFLSIPLSADYKNNDVAKVLSEYQAVHEMNGDDQLYCVYCDKLSNMETENVITEWPDILTLQLKRFETTFSLMGDVYYRKNEYKAKFPEQMPNFSDNYELFAIINHQGTFSGGHYKAFIKDEHNWFNFDDHNVVKWKRTSGELINNSCTSAYLLMYRREELKEDQSCGPQKRPNERKRSDPISKRSPNEMLADTKHKPTQRGNNRKLDKMRNQQQSEEQKKSHQLYPENNSSEKDNHPKVKKIKTQRNSSSPDKWPAPKVELKNSEEPRDDSDQSHQEHSLPLTLSTNKDIQSRRGNITEEGCAALFQALRSHSSHLRELDLSYNDIKDSGAEQISFLLDDSQGKLEKLRLKACGIGERGISLLLLALASNPSHLRELDLSENTLYYSGMKDVNVFLKQSGCRLVKLMLRSCYITEEGCADLCSALKSKPSHLRELDLSYNGIRDSGLKQISTLFQDPQCKLEKLWLISCKIAERSCADLCNALKSNPSHLRELDLSDNYIRYSGLKQISALLEDPQCKLEKIWLRYCDIYFSNADLGLKSNLSRLRELDLSYNGLQYSGLKQISALLEDPRCKLEKLWLRSCRIYLFNDESILKSNFSRLRELDLSYNSLGDVGRKLISAFLEDPRCKLEKLWLRYCSIDIYSTDPWLALKSNPSNLRELDLSYNSLGDVGVKQISALLEDPQCNLEKLWLRSCNITEEGCADLCYALKSNPSHLRELDLSYNSVGDLRVKQFSALLEDPQCKLQKLWLISCNIQENCCADQRSVLTSNPLDLRELDLSYNDIRESGFKQISALLEDPQCRLEKLRSPEINTFADLRSDPSHLRELNLSYNDIRDSGLKQISALLEDPRCKLEKLCLRSGYIKGESAAALISNPSHLRELNLSYNDIRDSGLKQISAFLKGPQRKLEKIRLRSCNITEEGCAGLCYALKSNPSHLRELDLSDNYIRYSGLKQISALLEDPQCKLEKLWLRACNIFITTADLLLAWKSNLSRLRELDLSFNYLGYSGLKQISALLEDPRCKLEKLWLSSCCIYLFNDNWSLKSNLPLLRELDLSYNDIGDSGVKQISAILEDPRCKLEKLWLRSCNIKEEGCADLCSSLKSNISHLRELDLSYNDIGDSGVKQISALLEDPQCKLEKIWLKSCSITYDKHFIQKKTLGATADLDIGFSQLKI